MRTVETVALYLLAGIGALSLVSCALLVGALVFWRGRAVDPRIEADERAQILWEQFQAAHVWSVDQ